MRSGEEGTWSAKRCLFLPHTLCSPTHSPAPSLYLSSPKPLPRYGGFSLGGRDPDLPSGREVVRTVAEIRALLSPQPGNALDRILNNLTQWALGLDTRNSLKVGAGAGRQGWPRTPKVTHISEPYGPCSAQIWFNNKGWHAMVAFVNRASNGLLHALLPSGPVRHAHSITTLNHPLNLTKEQLSEATL